MSDTKARTRLFGPGFWVFLAAFAAVTWLEGERQRAQALTEERLADLQAEATPRMELEQVRAEFEAFQEQLALLRGDLQEEVQRTALFGASARERLDATDQRLGNVGRAIEAQSTGLSSMIEDSLDRGALASALDEREGRVLAEVEKRWENLAALVSSAQELADRSAQQVAFLDAELKAQPDLAALWREVVGPVVQLAGETSVGSGVLLPSRRAADEEAYGTYLLTAWHVVRDIQGDLSRKETPVPVTIYDEDGGQRAVEASLVCFDAGLDAALLEIRTDEPLPNGARLASRERLAALHIFDAVFAVGCPLGNDPIPTRGEIATRHHEIEGQNYWMINAPTYIGNSGGGIFDQENRELVGIFSKIYTHGSLRPTIVPHMGLVTPLAPIYDGLEAQGYGELVDEAAAPAERLAAAKH